MSRLNHYILLRHRTQSWTFALVCLFAPYLVWQDVGDLLDPNYLQTLKAGGRERERERETSACMGIPCNLEKISCIGAENDTWRYFSCASAFARQPPIFNSIYALHAFYRMPKYLN